MSTSAYAFLAAPPSTTVAHSATIRRYRSSTFSAGIVKWATNVQPGSPSRSPRGASLLSGSSTNFSHLIDAQAPISIQVQSPSVGDFKPTGDNLLAHGYTSVFVHLPETPKSAFPFPKRSSPANNQPTTPPPQKTKSKGLKRLRSFALLRGHNRSQSPTAAVLPVPAPKSPHSRYPASPTTKRKHRQAQVPPALAQELLMMQFLDGGRIDEAAARLMEANAKAAGVNGVGAVYRDGQGGIWLDKEEKEEYDRLINSPTSPEWIQFGSDIHEGDAPMVLDLAELDHRMSVSAFSACTAELISRSPLQPEDPRALCIRNNGIEGFSVASTQTESKKAKHTNKRRPAPLKLSPPALPLPPIPRPLSSAPLSQFRMKVNAFEDSFAPAIHLKKRPTNQHITEPTALVTKPLRGKTSMARLHVKGLLGVKQ